MAKNIALCFDGTWNDPDSNTNVIKMHRSIIGEDRTPKPVGGAVAPRDESSIKWYDKGVGTKFLNKFRGGLAGNGLAKNILQGYKFIVDNYEQDDRIYLFGFSRGAYTARSLAGLIRNIGILHKSSAPAVELENNPVLMNAFRIYQRRDAGPKSEEAEFFRNRYSMDNVSIHFLGVWDTVGAMGLPSNNLDRVDPRYGFHDTNLSSRVKNAFHALALDETRPEFIPSLWTSNPDVGQRVEQVWFVGVHSEVGGGMKPSLTDSPLRWMQEKAEECGLGIDNSQIACIRKDLFIRAQVSNHFRPPLRNLLAWYYPLVARLRGSIPHVRPMGGTQTECVHSLVHQKKDARDSGYAPGNHGFSSVATCPGDGGEWECE